jgi:phosphate transport system substrate-binding protein
LKARFVLFAVVLALSCGCVRESGREDLTVAGSTTVQPIITKASEDYEKVRPNVRIGVQGGGSGTGVRMVGEGSVAIGASSRELNSEERKTHPQLSTHVIAVDGIAIVVHPSNVLSNMSLSVERIRDIFSGNITNYMELGGPDRKIVLVEREDGSGTRSSFESMVMGGLGVSDAALQKPASGAIRFTVSANENAIGYVGIGYLDNETIKPVAVDGVLPTEENIRAKDYPLSRDLYLVTDGEPVGLAKDFIDYLLSDAGQEIVKEEGFVRIR